MARRVHAAMMVGRDAEVRVLRIALAAARSGQARFVAIGGPSGVGKTRLARALADEATAAGMSVHTGSCPPETSAGPVPFAPFLAVARSIARGVDARRLDDLLGAGRLALASVLPELGAGIGAPVESAATWPVLEAMRLLLERASRSGPMVIVLEDLQWAGPSAQALLSLVVQEVRDVPILFLGTYRNDHAAASDLLELLAELDRLETTDRIELGPLGKADAAALLALIAGPTVDQVDRADILRRAGGMPIYLEQLAAGAGGPQGLPVSVRRSVALRIADLDDVAARVVRIVAFAGGALDVRLLGVVAGTTDAALVEAVRAAIEAGLLATAEPGAEEVEIRHAVVADALVAGLVPGEARWYGHAIAAALRAEPGVGPQTPADRASLVARVLVAAGDDAEAVPALIESARASSRAGAFAESDAAYERALSIAGRPVMTAGGVAAGDSDPVVVLEDAARAAWLAGRPARAVMLAHEAEGLGGTRPAGPRSRLRLAKASYQAAAGDLPSAMATLEQLLAETSPGRVRWRALADLGRWSTATGDAAAGIRRCEEALSGARADSDVRGVAAAAAALGVALSAAGRHEEALAAFEEAQRWQPDSTIDDSRSRLGGLPDALLRRLDVAVHRATLMDHDGALSAALQARSTASELGLDAWFGEFASAIAALELVRMGRWEEAGGVVMDGLPSGPLAVVGALLEVRRGDLEAADRLLALVGPTVPVATPGIDWPLLEERTRAELARARGQSADARRAIERGQIRPGTAPWTDIADLLVLAVAVEADAAAWSRSCRDTAAAQESRRRADEAAARAGSLLATASPTERPTLDGWRRATEARLAAELARVGGPDLSAWELARTAADAAMGPYERATVRLHWCATALELGLDRAIVRERMLEALALAAGLGADALTDALRRLLERARMRVDAGGSRGPEDGTPRAAARALGLSDREVDVLEVLATGATDREIASRLFISQKTAGHHVSHILARLGVARRGEAAAEARRLGIHGPPD